MIQGHTVDKEGRDVCILERCPLKITKTQTLAFKRVGLNVSPRLSFQKTPLHGIIHF